MLTLFYLEERLQQRIREQSTAPLAAGSNAERRRQLEVEYAAGNARLRHDLFRVAPLLTGLTFAVVVALAGWGFHQDALMALAAAIDLLSTALSSQSPIGSLPLSSWLCLLLVAAIVLFWTPARRWVSLANL